MAVDTAVEEAIDTSVADSSLDFACSSSSQMVGSEPVPKAGKPFAGACWAHLSGCNLQAQNLTTYLSP